MTPYAVQVGDLTSDDLIALKVADELLQRSDMSDDLTCHDVVHFWTQHGGPGEARTGRWLKAHEHSWIELRPDVILDLYPVAQTRPLLIYVGTPFLRDLYVAKKEPVFEQEHLNTFPADDDHG